MEEELLIVSGSIGDRIWQKRRMMLHRNFRAFTERPEKPRVHGMTEIQGPYYTVMGPQYLQDTLETMGNYVDGLKFSGGCFSLMPRDAVKQMTSLAHEHGVYVSSSGWAEHVLHKGPRIFKQYVQDCKDLGFDTVELNTDFINLPEDDLLQLIRVVKNAGLKAKPELGLHFDGRKEVPDGVSALKGTLDESSVIKRAERCLEAGADIIMIDSHGITENVSNWRTDLVAQIIEHLGIEKIMFEANDPRVFEWFIKNYGPKVNLFVDHSQIVQLEGLRSGMLGPNHTWGRLYHL